MKTLFAAFLFLAATTMSWAQSAEQIVKESIEAIGGKAWDNVNGILYKATMEDGGMKIPIEIVYMRDGRMYVRFAFQGMEITQMAYDGTNVWNTNFMTQKAEKSDSETVENFKRELGAFPNALFNYKSLGYQIALDGEEKVDGVDCYKIKLTRKNQLIEGVETPNVEYYFIDKDSKALIQTESEILSGEMKGKMEQEKFSDYQEVNGVYVAFSTTMGVKDGMSQTLSFTEIIINPTIDDKAFAFPAQ
jgi:outer membrane lipoprotein-sorting protein